jgi:transcriptional regulator with XRE-family HTH domain
VSQTIVFITCEEVPVPEVRQAEKDLLLLGEAFRALREQHGLSAGELATATGVDGVRIVALEEGCLDPDYELLVTLAEGIGVSCSAFFLRAEELAARGTET